MSWKTILIDSKSTFKIKNSQLEISREIDGSKEFQNWGIELEKLDSIVVDNLYTTFSTPSIIECAKNNIPIIINDNKHDPKAIVLSLCGSKNILNNFYNQIELNKRKKGLIWKTIIKSQLDNQIRILRFQNADHSLIKKFKNFKNDINQGDPKNIEAYAARLFFQEMFGIEFVRKTNNPLDGAYNYGIKIIVSKISSLIISYGMHPSLGVHHKGRENFFNLSYDLVEPLRPLVIFIVLQNINDINHDLSLEVRIKLVDILNYYVFFKGARMRLKHALEKMVKSFVSVLKGTSDFLYLPEVIPYLNIRDLDEIERN